MEPSALQHQNLAAAPGAPAGRRRREFLGLRMKLLLLFVILGAAPLVTFALGLEGLAHDTYKELIAVAATPEVIERANGLLTLAVVVFAVLLAVVLAAALVISWMVARPAQQLADALKHIAAGNYDVRANPNSNDELGEAAELVNALARQMKDVRQREDEILKLKAELLRVTAHQLRTPLTAVQWALGSLQEVADDLPKPQRRALQQGTAANESLIDIVHDLLDVADIEEGKFAFNFQPTDILGIIEEQMKILTDQAHAKNITMRVIRDHASYVPPVVVDPAKIRLVLQNVLDNAVKYSKPGGEVRVSVRKEAGFIAVAIADSGIGIPKEDLNNIFAKFYRGKNARAASTEGSGLGLFISHNIIVRHGGQMRVESEEGNGTTVTFTLPIDRDLIPKQEVIGEFLEEL